MNNKTYPILAILFLTGVLSTSHAQTPKATPVIVMIDHVSSGFITRINNKIPEKGLLLALSQMRGAEHEQQPGSILLVHIDAKISMLVNIKGIMGKAGYVKPLVYYFSRDKDRMYPINISGAVPFRSN